MTDTRLLTIDDVARALGYITRYDDRDTWLKMAMSLKSEFGEAGFDVWDNWSQQSDLYKSSDARSVWKSVKSSGRVGIGTLIKLAQDNGFKFSVREIDEQERERRKKEAIDRREANKKRRAAEAQAHKEKQETAAQRANEIWPNLKREGHSPYLARKQIHGFGCRFGRDGSLAVPVYRGADIVGLQWISADGSKKFLTGTAKSGASFVIKREGENNPLVLCEGYATGCSVAMALPDHDVVICFDSGNLKKIADAVYRDDLVISIAADNDYQKAIDKPDVGNTGIKAARAIIDKYPAIRAYWPAELPCDPGASGTDFNDLHVSNGLSAVKAVFSAQEAQVFPPLGGETFAQNAQPGEYAPPDADELEEPPQISEKSRGKSPRLGGEGGFVFSLESMLHNYAHVYGKSPQIFDKRARKLISPSTLHEIAEGAYKEWKKSPDRHIVDELNVVFDPSMQADPDTTVNLFGGFPLKPKPGQCDRIIDLLYYLVGENDNAFDWLLKWIALPLQKPGAKMRTAIVMHGSEGAGKNLFWSVIERVYGEYSTIITQNEIESQFNGWASKKLFVIGNEVVSRQEMYHKKGIIKNMITEPAWLINDKNMPLRQEANHANFVFFSNVMQPVTPDTGDRRFMVVWTPVKREPEYYGAIVDQINNGGVQAFYHYLLKLDLSDFNEFALPILTQAKDDLIDLSMRSDERFIKRWKVDELPIPFQLCRTVDLYAAYQHWARVEGEKFTVSKTEFLMRLSHDQEAEKLPAQRYMASGGKTGRTTFIGPAGQMARRPGTTSNEKYVGDQSDGFVDAFNEWKGVNDYAK